MKAIVLSLVMVFSLFLQIDNADARKYRAIKAKKSYSYTQKTQNQAKTYQKPESNKKALAGAAIGAAAGGLLGYNMAQEDDCDMEDVLEGECSPSDFDGFDFSDILLIIGFIVAILLFIKHKRHTRAIKSN
jgi:hypothetical protein